MIHILNAATLQQGLQEAAGRWHEVPVQLNGDWTPRYQRPAELSRKSRRLLLEGLERLVIFIE
jgi:hypothetical protein